MSMLALLVAALLAQSTPGSARALLQDCKATMEGSTVEALTTAVDCANTGTTTEIDIINDLSAPDLEVYELSSSVEVRGQVPGQWGQNGLVQNGIDININDENVFSGGGGGGAKLTNIAFVFNGTGASSAPPSFSLAAMTFNPMDNQTVVLGVGSGNLKISATSFDTITNATAVVVLDSMSLITSSTSFDDCASPDAGGAMRFNSSGSFKLSSTDFTNVRSDAQGGALWLSTGGNAARGGFPIGPPVISSTPTCDACAAACAICEGDTDCTSVECFNPTLSNPGYDDDDGDDYDVVDDDDDGDDDDDDDDDDGDDDDGDDDDDDGDDNYGDTNSNGDVFIDNGAED